MHLRSKRILLKASLWTAFSLFSLMIPAWGGAYMVDQLFMLSLSELMAVSVDMVLPPN